MPRNLHSFALNLHFLERKVRRAHFIPIKFLNDRDSINEPYLQPQAHHWPTQGPHYTNYRGVWLHEDLDSVCVVTLNG